MIDWDNRFWSKVVPEALSGCWLWHGARNERGYGIFKGSERRAHRESWKRERGTIPPNTLVLHSCDVRACVNPDHLFLGSPRSNTDDMMKKGRGVKVVSEDMISEMKRLFGLGWSFRAIGRSVGLSHHAVHRNIRRPEP